MDTSPVSVIQLLRRDPTAWTALLGQDDDLDGVSVREVTAEPAGDNPQFTRFVLQLAGHSDPISLLAKKTNEVEARFYNELAHYVSSMSARCWLNHQANGHSWVVLDDVPNHRPGLKWSADDVEALVSALVTLHSTFWELAPYLAARSWLPAYLSAPKRDAARRGYYEMMRENSPVLGLGRAATVSAHAMQVAGDLAPTFVRVAAGVEVLQQLGGWPGVLEKKHLEVIAELLDDPLPVIQPLRELPVTLLHGQPAPEHWRITLFNERFLMDWDQANVGPPICDLIMFLENARILWLGPDGPGYRPVTEETLVDSYILRMSMRQGKSFPAREMRRAMPAALCLHVITTWLPRFAEWFQPFIGSPYSWDMITHLQDHQLDQVGLPQLVGLRPYLRDLFLRFHKAYKSL